MSLLAYVPLSRGTAERRSRDAGGFAGRAVALWESLPLRVRRLTLPPSSSQDSSLVPPEGRTR